MIFIIQVKLEEMKGLLHKKKTEISSLMEKTSEVRRMQDELQENLSVVCVITFINEHPVLFGFNLIFSVVS